MKLRESLLRPFQIGVAKKMLLVKFAKLILASFALLIFGSPAVAETWGSDWGDVYVAADGDQFVARYNTEKNGIIVMRNQGGGNYSGYWARQCTNSRRHQIPAPVFSSEGSCDERREDSEGRLTRCWGGISGHANVSNTKFMGTFYTCNGKRMGEWNGWR